MIDLAGLLVAAALLITLVAIEVQRAGADSAGSDSAGPDTGRPTRARLLSRTASRSIVAVLWAMCLLLVLPRVLGLLV
ncbi:hypothetical protein [Sinomonas mesophila]|uniref:hypothetical protein n=1 Tax=Sinomonas mesophila TaxID=1531955 RepID=UPI000987B014|nr:hypothetical protein [Sinomonas mesophila]